MEKILLAVNASQLNTQSLEFACYVARLTRSKLTGVFLENLQGDDAPALKSVYGMPYVETIVATDIPANKTKMKLCEENIRVFEEACKSRCVDYAIHRDRGVPVEEIIIESRFADLLIVDSETSFRERQEKIPTGFIKDVLSKAECPVVIAPFDFYGVEELLFSYDGSPAAAFAIKQFTYLFPELGIKKLTILQVNEKEAMPVVEEEKLEELLRARYTSISYQVLQGKPNDELFGYLLGKKSVFVIMGAFGRNILSGFFRRSTAELLIQTVNAPVFIAHP